MNAETVTTTYTYNGDGALTAVEVEGGTGAGTTYLTWDNFTPARSDPAIGTLKQGNGNLASIGSQPGGPPQFTFDARDRLTSYSEPQSAAAQDYDYSAANLLCQAELGSDALHFYYDEASGRVTNQKQSATGLMSGRLSAGRYLSDGSEQVLLLPRKDTAGLYSPSDNALEPYNYGPFGVPEGVAKEDGLGYDLAKNPFQYAGEYRDPVWGGYYLRARWYDPDLPAFISRDPAQNINRYAYAGGNPIMHVDPGGKNFIHGMGRFFAGLSRDMNKGVGGVFARLFLAPLMGPLAIAAQPSAFWHAIEHDTSGIDVFLALGILSEGIGGYMDSRAVQDVVAVSRVKRYGLRSLSDLGIGLGQSVAAGAHRGWTHFNWKAFSQGVEATAGVNIFWRGLGGFNVRSRFRSSSATADLVEDFASSNPANHEALVFRARSSVPGGGLGRWIINHLPLPKDAPLFELADLGAYHESLISVEYSASVTRDSFTVYASDVESTGINRQYLQGYSSERASDLFRDATGQSYELVGLASPLNRQQMMANPLGFVPDDKDAPPLGAGPGGATTYSTLSNNCHAHAFAVLRGLGLR